MIIGKRDRNHLTQLLARILGLEADKRQLLLDMEALKAHNKQLGESLAVLTRRLALPPTETARPSAGRMLPSLPPALAAQVDWARMGLEPPEEKT